MSKSYTIKTISQKTGLTISTLHYYEKVGLMPPSNVTQMGIAVLQKKTSNGFTF